MEEPILIIVHLEESRSNIWWISLRNKIPHILERYFLSSPEFPGRDATEIYTRAFQSPQAEVTCRAI